MESQKCPFLNFFSIFLVPVRLSDGVSPSQGRAEVFAEGQWQSLCGFGWSSAAATVVCRMLGFPPATGAPEKSAFGIGSVSMWLHTFSCQGAEYQLLECPMDTTFSPEELLYFCGDGDEAGVVCGTPIGKYYFSCLCPLVSLILMQCYAMAEVYSHIFL